MRILGVSCYYHDSAAALVEDGIVVAACEEERFSRIKHDSSFPKAAIDFCLKQAKIKSLDLDYAVFYEKPFLKFERIMLSALSTAPFGRKQFINGIQALISDKLWIKASLAKHLSIPAGKILFCSHHLSHAASAFYTSSFESAAILTCDGVGEWTTTAWGKGKGNKINLDSEIRFPHSLGLLYSAFTQFLGFEVNEGEYKVMGLAPYGKPLYVDLVNKLIKQQEDGAYELDLSYFNFHKSDQLSYSDKFTNVFKSKDYADIASSVQFVLEQKLVNLAKYIRQKTKEKNLCYAGGVALNGCANWRIFKEAGFDNIHIHPAAGDSGGAIGAAAYLYHHILSKPRKARLNNIYLGAANSPEEIEFFIKKEGVRAKKLSEAQLEDQVADLLCKGKVVGWVRGRFEWGPRALGARSILADPRNKKMKDIVNRKIKFREAFRPFAPVCLFEKGKNFFEIEGAQNQTMLEHMLAVVPVKKKAQNKLGAVTHVDGTARPQLIKKELNPIFYNIIKKFGQKVGVPVLLNTSFNLKGEPIVNSIRDAYDTFIRSGLDVLVAENYLINKK